ncbi:hypothetical protein HR060_12055 [Catenovulum sp. SM1970]|uniref:hypothetical protein n=1 Tax=Marinifaba aquimaris TaxID=2741323 RepID=UPI0015725BC0|nr:hypothetical protein [Marinifaba aquimaris]NTS77593.1 hypothetical protein [Marinifaba aquimaris]
MKVSQFIELKRRQISFYVTAFTHQTLPYSELHLFLWDTLEEWQQVKVTQNEPYSKYERVFWHLMHLLSYWSEKQLLKDQYLRDELTLCVEFLDGEGCFPVDCVGIRP